jgi:hypothetical protein
VKKFGRRAAARQPAPREEFEFTFLRDEEPETHRFAVRAITDVVGLTSTLLLAKRSPEEAMPAVLRVIAKMLDNKDGTPHGWHPVAVTGSPAANPDGPAPEGVPQDVAQERKFRGPDGHLYTFEHAARFQAFEAGSSRRRWLHLIDDDDFVSVDAQDLMELFEWVVGLAAGRPTQPSS